jgi:cysteinyl-tRNA synthetase
MELTFLDTLTRTERSITPSAKRPMQMYVCGPTVYAPPHVGHARTYIVFDMVKRFFQVQGGKAHHIQNITDFEDKITMRATTEGITWEALARRETKVFFSFMNQLNILKADANPLSTLYVKMMISIIRTLEKRGFTYTKGRSIYFDASRLIHTRNFSAEEFLSAHAIPEPGMHALTEAQDPRDFVLWKPSRPPAPSWDSPWGKGMPGWHIECYAMASRHLTLPMDIHGGGMDLIFPHHYAENLICLALRKVPFSHNFLHDAIVTMDARKMAKSTGNLVTIEKALAQVSPAGLRIYLLSKDYGERLEFSMYEACQADSEWLEDQDTFFRLSSTEKPNGYPLKRLRSGLQLVMDAMGNDLGTSEALRSLHIVAEDVRRRGPAAMGKGEKGQGRKLLSFYERLLGLPLVRPSVERYSCS